jgi:citrate lyase subunit beta/citryl-CoA lyase
MRVDYQLDLGMACERDEHELAPARSAIVLASRHADIASPIDGVTVDWKDTERLERDSMRARRAGFGAKLCIHPDQIPIVDRSLGPTLAEVEWAARVLAAWVASDGSVVSLDGRMVDAPVVQLARRVVTRAGAQGALSLVSELQSK